MGCTVKFVLRDCYFLLFEDFKLKEPVHLIDCAVNLKRFSHVANCDQSGISINDENVVINCVRPLIAHMISKSEGEDDTKSLLQIIKVINSLLYFHGTVKEEFEGR
jgi:hypothetical protein